MYGKLFEQTFTGSMFGAGPVIFAVWGYAVANCQPDHCVELNPTMLAAALGADPAEVEAAIESFCAPDPKSRSKAEDGRRLLRQGEFLYLMVNHSYYCSMRDNADRKEYLRIKKRESRARQADVKNVKPCQPVCQPIHTAYTERLVAPEDGATEDPPSKTPTRGKQQSHRGNPDIPALVKFYEVEFARTRGQAPVVRHGSAEKSFQALLAGRTLGEARAVVTDFLEHPPQFYADRSLADPEHIVKAANTILARRRE